MRLWLDAGEVRLFLILNLSLTVSDTPRLALYPAFLRGKPTPGLSLCLWLDRFVDRKIPGACCRRLKSERISSYKCVSVSNYWDGSSSFWQHGPFFKLVAFWLLNPLSSNLAGTCVKYLASA